MSNSSTSSYLISLEEFDNVLELAGYYLLEVIGYEESEYDKKRANYYKELYKNTLRASESGLDLNTPVFFPTHNFETYIVRRDDAYYIDTDHCFSFDIKGPYIGGLDEGDYRKYTKREYYYMPEFDILGRREYVPSGAICGNADHDDNYVLKNGEILCPLCHKDQLQNYKISPELEEEHLNAVDARWKEKFRHDSEYFNLSRLRDLMRDLGVEMAALNSMGHLSLYLEAIVKNVTRKCIEIKKGKKITIQDMEKAINWIQTIKINRLNNGKTNKERISSKGKDRDHESE